MSKFFNDLYDEDTSTPVKVSRIAASAVLAGCAAMFYMILAL